MTEARGLPALGALALACCLGIAGCGSGREALPLQAPVPPEDCAHLYVVAPGNFIVDLASGAAVMLEPSVREFPLFCSPATAAAALEAAQAAGRIPQGDWRVYRLEGDFAELVQPAEPGGPSPYDLARRARLADWVDDPASGADAGKREAR